MLRVLDSNSATLCDHAVTAVRFRQVLGGCDRLKPKSYSCLHKSVQFSKIVFAPDLGVAVEVAEGH